MYFTIGTLRHNLHHPRRTEGYRLDWCIPNLHHVWRHPCHCHSRIEPDWWIWKCLVSSKQPYMKIFGYRLQNEHSWRHWLENILKRSCHNYSGSAQLKTFSDSKEKKFFPSKGAAYVTPTRIPVYIIMLADTMYDYSNTLSPFTPYRKHIHFPFRDQTKLIKMSDFLKKYSVEPY